MCRADSIVTTAAQSALMSTPVQPTGTSALSTNIASARRIERLFASTPPPPDMQRADGDNNIVNLHFFAHIAVLNGVDSSAFALITKKQVRNDKNRCIFACTYVRDMDNRHFTDTLTSSRAVAARFRTNCLCALIAVRPLPFTRPFHCPPSCISSRCSR